MLLLIELQIRCLVYLLQRFRPNSIDMIATTLHFRHMMLKFIGCLCTSAVSRITTPFVEIRFLNKRTRIIPHSNLAIHAQRTVSPSRSCSSSTTTLVGVLCNRWLSCYICIAVVFCFMHGIGLLQSKSHVRMAMTTDRDRWHTFAA